MHCKDKIAPDGHPKWLTTTCMRSPKNMDSSPQLPISTGVQSLDRSRLPWLVPLDLSRSPRSANKSRVLSTNSGVIITVGHWTFAEQNQLMTEQKHRCSDIMADRSIDAARGAVLASWLTAASILVLFT